MTNHFYMLDTNMASYLIKGQHPAIERHILVVPPSQICISAITEAELLLGLAKKPGATQLEQLVREFLLRVNTLPWDSSVTPVYAQLRANFKREGNPLGAMDMLIAAHAAAIDAILVTNDKAFSNLKKYLRLEDWTKARKH